MQSELVLCSCWLMRFFQFYMGVDTGFGRHEFSFRTYNAMIIVLISNLDSWIIFLRIFFLHIDPKILSMNCWRFGATRNLMGQLAPRKKAKALRPKRFRTAATWVPQPIVCECTMSAVAISSVDLLPRIAGRLTSDGCEIVNLASPSLTLSDEICATIAGKCGMGSVYGACAGSVENLLNAAVDRGFIEVAQINGWAGEKNTRPGIMHQRLLNLHLRLYPPSVHMHIPEG